MESNSYRCWRNTFRIALRHFDMLSHRDNNAPRPNNAAWVQADLTILMWLHATLTDDLMQLPFFNLGINYGFQASGFAITYDIVYQYNFQ